MFNDVWSFNLNLECFIFRGEVMEFMFLVSFKGVL